MSVQPRRTDSKRIVARESGGLFSLTLVFRRSYTEGSQFLDVSACLSSNFGRGYRSRAMTNTLGKLCVIFILTMSLIFLGFSISIVATHKDWYGYLLRPSEGANGEPMGLIPQEKEQASQLTNLKAKYESLQKNLEQEQTALRTRYSQLQTKLDQDKKAREALTAELAKFEKDRRTLIAELKTAQEDLSARLVETDNLRKEKESTEAERDDLFDKVVSSTDELHQAEIELKRLQEMTVVLGEDLARFETALSDKGLSPDSPIDDIPPKLDGVILAQNGNGRVEISLGADDGLAEGHTLVVYRQSAGVTKFLGEIKVLQTLKDKSVAEIIPELKKAPFDIQDRVATRLN